MTNQHASAAGKLLCALLFLTFSFGHASAQSLTITPVTKNVNYAIGGYYECLPPDYKTNTSKKYPLLIFIHGIGELGDGSSAELPRVLKFGIPKLINRGLFPSSVTVNGQTSSFIVIAPQFRANYRDAAAVSTLIDYCAAHYRVDPDRIYLTGLSMGGGISWIYAAKSAANSNRIAALLVIAGNTNASSGGVANIASTNLPVWITHNDGDPIVPVSNSKNWEKGLNGYTPAINPKTLLNIFNSDSHDAWSKTYDPDFKPNGLNVYEWMLSHHRGSDVPETPTNQAPVAKAGTDQTITLPANSVMLNGAATDADGSVDQYTWTKVSGPETGTIETPNKSFTTVSGLTEGIYTFRLTVKDNNGATDADDVKITVKQAANIVPVANAGNDITITLPQNSVVVSGDGSDEDGTVASYLWTKVSGPAENNISDKTSAKSAITGLVQGTYIFQLTITDNKGATATDEVKVVVKAEKPATPNAGADTLVYKNQSRPDSVFLNGRASVGGTKYNWRKISGPGVTSLDDSTALNTIAIGLVPGTHLFQLTIDGKWSDTMAVVVRNWQAKNESPCRPGGGKSFIVPESSAGQYNYLYINRDNLLGEPVMGGDTLYFKGGTFTAFEIGDIGGGAGCPVYIMPKDEAVVITDGYFRIGAKDSNVVQHVVLDGTALRSKSIPYGFFIDNHTVPAAENNYSGLVAYWVSDLTVKGYHSINTGILQIKLDAKEALYGRYDKFIQKRIRIQDNFIDGSSAEGLYIGNTASNGGQLNNPYGAPPRMDSVEITDNIITNCNWDGIQLANARTEAIIRHNLIYKVGLLNQASQRAGILMGANTTGIIDSNIVINSTGNGIQVFGYGAVKVHSNIVDSIYGGTGDQDGIYQSHLAVVPETFNIPLSVNNFGNLVSRVERKAIRIANNSGTMIPGHTYYNTFIDSVKTEANNLINANASDELDHNRVINSFPFKVNELSTRKGAPFISMTQGDATETFTNVKEVVDWLFNRLKGNSSDNEAPVANAGTDRNLTLPEDNVLLQGSGADIDGSVVAYQWKQLSGDSAQLRTPDAAATMVTGLLEGTYAFELTVTDNGKATGADTLVINVKAAALKENIKPTVYAGTPVRLVLPQDSLTLQGRAADEDGTITAVKWTKVSGPDAYQMSNDTNLTTTVKSLVAGTYKFELLATDNQGATAVDTIKITVVPGTIVTPKNQVPVANAGADQTIQLPVDYTVLNGLGVDADGTVDKYHWEKISGPNEDVLENSNAATTPVTGLVKGTYVYQLSVTDNMGATKADTVKITVLPKKNTKPVANAGSSLVVQLPENATILNGKGVDEDGTITSYQWRQVSGPASVTLQGSTTAQAQLRNLKEGAYVYELKVTDNEGAWAVDSVAIQVKAAIVIPNKAPVAYAGNNQTLQLPVNTAVLSGSGLDEDGVLKNFHWRQLSGPSTATWITPNELQATVKNLAAGAYQFALKVTDNNGASDEDTVSVLVKAAVVIPNKAPLVSVGSDIALTLPVNKATLTGTAKDTDGNITAMLWTKLTGSAQYTIAKPQAAQTEISNLARGEYTFEFKATDNKGAISRDTIKITVQPSVTRPMFVMDAGADQEITLPTDSVELEGVVDDPYKTVKSYSWKKVSGPQTFKLQEPNTAQTMVTDLEEGIYQFVCTAKDENGNTLSDTVQIKVNVLAQSTAALFPNPAENIVYVKIESNTRATNTTLVMYDLGGRVVYREEFMRTAGQMVKALDVSKLQRGAYTIRIGTDINNISTLKLIKQ